MKKSTKKKEQKAPVANEVAENESVVTSTNPTMRIVTELKKSFEFRLNVGNQKMEFRRLGAIKYVDLKDTDLNSIKVRLNLKNIPCSKENLRTIIFSNLWPQYDPYLEFLSSLPEWDGHDYIADLASTVQTDNDRYFLWSLRKWLTGFVGSLADEETVNQIALILAGGQGIGKTKWFTNMLPPELRKYSSSGLLDPKDKETLVQLSELCCFNMDEVENLKPKYVEAIKELITKQSMYLRRAYTTLSQNYIRRCTFCGTANGIDILHDITGNRRFLCQNVLDVDYKLEGLNHKQLYAQAYHLYRSGFQFWLDQKEQAVVEIQNARFRAMSLEEELVNTHYEKCRDGEAGAKRMQAYQIQADLQQKTGCGRLNNVTIGKVLAAKGFDRIKSNGIYKWIVREKQQGCTSATVVKEVEPEGEKNDAA